MKIFKLELLSIFDVCIIYDGHSVTLQKESCVKFEGGRINTNRCLWSVKGLATVAHILSL